MLKTGGLVVVTLGFFFGACGTSNATRCGKTGSYDFSCVRDRCAYKTSDGHVFECARKDCPTHAKPLVTSWCAMQNIPKAKALFDRGDWSEARIEARKDVAAFPSLSWRIIGAASCNLKDRDGAIEAIASLDPQGKQYVRYVCEHNGINGL